MRLQVVTRLMLALAVVAAIGCTGDDEPEAQAERSTTTVAPETTTTAAATTSSTATTTATSTAESTPAAAAVIQLDDLGSPWEVEIEAVGAREAPADDCMTQAGIYEELAEGARHVGSTFKRGDAIYFVSSAASTFPDVAGADAMVARFTTPEHAACVVAGYNEVTAEASNGVEGDSWQVGEIFTAPPEGGEGGFAAAVQYQFQSAVEGEAQEATGFAQESLFRNGRTVLYTTLEGVAGDADAADLPTLAGDEWTAAAQAAIARAAE